VINYEFPFPDRPTIGKVNAVLENRRISETCGHLASTPSQPESSTSAGPGTTASVPQTPRIPAAEIKEQASCPSHSPSVSRKSFKQNQELGSLFHITECPICMEKYHHDEGRPKVLSCGHTFCDACLILIAHGPTVKCPTCRERIFLPDGVVGKNTHVIK
jgi:DNA-directed RNA polymerase subunit RPC12/RpoP